jgi:hypothetical protein
LEAVLSTGDPNVDPVDGHPIAYTKLQESQKFERPPIFVREDSVQIVQDPVNAEKVPGWTNTAAQVATGNRRMVLEDGPDKMNSDDDDALEEEHGDKLTGVYTSEMDPEKGPVKLTNRQAAVQRSMAQAVKAQEVAQKGFQLPSFFNQARCTSYTMSFDFERRFSQCKSLESVTFEIDSRLERKAACWGLTWRRYRSNLLSIFCA